MPSRNDLTETLCIYAETHGLEPSEDDDLYIELDEIAQEVIEKIDNMAYERQGDK